MGTMGDEAERAEVEVLLEAAEDRVEARWAHEAVIETLGSTSRPTLSLSMPRRPACSPTERRRRGPRCGAGAGVWLAVGRWRSRVCVQGVWRGRVVSGGCLA